MDDKSARVAGPVVAGGSPPGPPGPTADSPEGPSKDGATAASPPPAPASPRPSPASSPAPGPTSPAEIPAEPADNRSSFPPTVRRRTALTLEETRPLWELFRSGRFAGCPSDAGSLALSVDGASAYRLVCTQCGTASAWFEAAPNAGVRDRLLPPPADDDSTND
jgi:hypothetical protein